MPRPRAQQVSLNDTPYYHCVSRCVRRAFLCGVDHYSGQSYEHRRDWVEKSLYAFADVFCIDICAYAVMSNHLQLVLHLNPDKAQSLEFVDIIQRWHSIFRGNLLSQRYLKGETLSESEMTMLTEIVKEWRERLLSISWFMRRLCEPIAREVNKEDDCTGRFWEGRFKTQALLDEAALAACMAYVDLNPVRAKIAESPETSDYTSIKQRIQNHVQGKTETRLFPFIGSENEKKVKELPFELIDYIELVDWTARQHRGDKRGCLDQNTPTIMQRLGLSQAQWLRCSTGFEDEFSTFVGSIEALDKVKKSLNLQRIRQRTQCQHLSG